MQGVRSREVVGLGRNAIGSRQLSSWDGHGRSKFEALRSWDLRQYSLEQV
jgi:hypothetical protein